MDIDDIVDTLGDLDDQFSGGSIIAPSTDDFVKLVMCVKSLATIVRDEL